jgi:hypothetical protein
MRSKELRNDFGQTLSQRQPVTEAHRVKSLND